MQLFEDSRAAANSWLLDQWVSEKRKMADSDFFIYKIDIEVKYVNDEWSFYEYKLVL